ncbi:MAG: PQQ-dependent sugar dehydrogenase [Burkholderiales bacterium]|nr:PQQ-dependent sugar dehydrogenase [Phycisphaerae bacterium]
MLVRSLAIVFSLLIASAALAQTGGQVGANVPPFDVRKGYKVTLAAEGFGPARFMVLDDKGTLYISQPQPGKIVALNDKDKDGVYETRADFLTGYRQVHSMYFKDGWVYATSADDGGCKRARDTNGDGKADDVEQFLPPGSVPTRGGHPFRGIVLTDKHVFISVSDPGNLSADYPSANKSIYRFDVDGKNKMQFATGLRNTEKLALRPGTEEIWGLDHGSDNFGGKYGESKGNQPITDLIPGEELNMITEGAFYGHPFLSNNRIVRPEFADRPDIVELAAKTTPPAWVFGAHWSGLGFTFLEKDYFPQHKGDLIAAFHGSWNSTLKVGYRIERVLFDKETGKPYGSQQIVGTIGSNPNNPIARPVDCVEAADGSILFSCDRTNKIYRISKSD